MKNAPFHLVLGTKAVEVRDESVLDGMKRSSLERSLLAVI